MTLPYAHRAPAALHLALRAATSDLHDAVERRFAGYDLADRQRYGVFLTMQAAALLPLEAALERAGIARLLPDWPRRRRAAALRSDLAALGLDAPRADPPMLGGGGEAIGAAYVLEGSRLGAAVLLRRVGAGLPDGFLRHGARSGLWPSFLARLAAEPEAAAPAVIGGARCAFARFLGEAVPA